ncbi:hypothetical protein NEW05_004525, partial [Salmonella enterica]|nr:hypothetical protein [Salmonella enterica]
IAEQSNQEVEGAKAQFLIEKAKLAALEEKLASTLETQQQQINNIDEAKLARATISRELDELKYAVDYKQHLIYEHFLPTQDSAIEYVLRNLSSGNGCLACGNKSASSEYFEEKFKVLHQCPICNSALEQQNVNTIDLDVLNKDLQVLYRKIEILEKSYASQDVLLEKFKNELYKTETLLGETLIDLKSTQKQVRKIESDLPPDEFELQELRRIVAYREIELRQEDRIRI